MILKEMNQDAQSFHKKLTEKEITKSKRFDNYGNEITKRRKQRVTFIDKVKQVNFMDVIQIESLKVYNKTEEIKNLKILITVAFLYYNFFRKWKYNIYIYYLFLVNL